MTMDLADQTAVASRSRGKVNVTVAALKTTGAPEAIGTNFDVATHPP